jgi:HEAT repeat protein
MLRDVDLVAHGEGRPAKDAGDRLAAAGRSAVAMIETGLYAAEPEGRARLVRVLVRTGSDEALPILEHLAKHDPDPTVRELAARGTESHSP